MPDPFKVSDAGKPQPPVCYHPDMDPATWDVIAFGISFVAVDLFEAMPDSFTFDELTDFATKQALNATESVACLREWQDCNMITFDGQRFSKTGQKPYF